MKVGVFSSKKYDQVYLQQRSVHYGFDLEFLETRLGPETKALAERYDAICVFVNDIVDKTVLDTLKAHEIGHVALRCSGFNNVDTQYAQKLGISVSRVPAYSPEAVAEHTLALMLTLNRKLHKAYNRVKEGNFSLDGLMGFNMHGKTVGVIGTGQIGRAVVRILNGFGCRILCNDPYPHADVEALGGEYVDIESLFRQSDIITLHCPLTLESQHMINHDAIHLMKDGVMLINTSRGALVNTKAVVAGLKSQKIGMLGLDVYEMESELFFDDRSCEVIQDDVFQRLSSFHNVLITGHQGFFTSEAMQQISQTTLENLQYYFTGKVNPDTFL
ncbi:2-hydroxyacid dehydrogenase [Aestuariibacter salexigens]|uniref:2-hydroxyacid dehydrogenase n=1 Tax=Aestuariibacter salexigens TaxID=226010 RepID=UPI000424D63B|nr:2-hydroxyacid dehydrogenase [Aestuariibacter salexigens]